MIAAFFVTFWLASGSVMVVADQLWLKKINPYIAVYIALGMLAVSFGLHLKAACVLLGTEAFWYPVFAPFACMFWMLLCIKWSRRWFGKRSLAGFKKARSCQ